MTDAPKRILVRLDYDGTHDGHWIGLSPHEPPHPYSGSEQQYLRADIADDLLEALEDAYTLISGDSVGTEWKKGCREFLKTARAAISKAEGQTNE